jgi:hypothetical protein
VATTELYALNSIKGACRQQRFTHWFRDSSLKALLGSVRCLPWSRKSSKFLSVLMERRYNARRMSKAEKLFDKLTAGRNDANFPFDDLQRILRTPNYN